MDGFFKVENSHEVTTNFIINYDKCTVKLVFLRNSGYKSWSSAFKITSNILCFQKTFNMNLNNYS